MKDNRKTVFKMKPLSQVVRGIIYGIRTGKIRWPK